MTNNQMETEFQLDQLMAKMWAEDHSRTARKFTRNLWLWAIASWGLVGLAVWGLIRGF